MLKRGSIPRRVPDPSRKQEPPVVIQKAPMPFWQDCGEPLVPGNGLVKIYEMRFVRAGRIEDCLVSADVPDGAAVSVVLMDDKSNELLRSPINSGANKFPSAPVPAGVKFSVWLSQENGEGDVVVPCDIAFVFQER